MKHDIIRDPSTILSLSDVIDSFIDVRYLPFNYRGRHSEAFVMIFSGSCNYTFDDGNSFTVQHGEVLYLARGLYMKWKSLWFRTNLYSVIFFLKT